MDLSLFFSKAATHFEKALPFVLFADANSEKVTGYFQQDTILHTTTDYNIEGFVIAPFDYQKEANIILKDHCEVLSSEIKLHTSSSCTVAIENSTDAKEAYVAMVHKAIDYISKNTFEKVVVSRQKKIAIPNFNVITLFEAIFSKHTNTLRYVWFHPQTGIWCGATPETLIELKDTSFKTMSLAGTQKVSGLLEPRWSDKERMEQQIVTDAIYESLNTLTPVIKISKPYNHKAGNLYHICADVTGIMKTKYAKLDKLINALHPTPAVCGMPTCKAKDFILNYEGYDRSYYTGFLGNIRTSAKSSKLYVNLRCMQIHLGIATLYVGGGIVLTSNPENEWIETENKLQTMAEVIASFL